MEKKVGVLFLIVCKNYNSLTRLNDFFAIFYLKELFIGWGRKQKTNENPWKNPR
jgi:hypothetical protein